MTTFVGTQNEFSDALKALVELDYDAVEAYKTAVSKLSSEEYRNKLAEFMGDHQRHIKELTTLLEAKNIFPPAAPSLRQWLTKGKVWLAEIIGDKSILSAMLSNENDTNAAYEKMVERSDKWPEASQILEDGLQDEKRHKAWLLSQQ